jgi:phosphopantothenoylcysteine decarboxylase/phosphopantothenate--cysteine ligase
VLISGPTHLQAPAGAEMVAVRSAREMHTAVHQHAAHADIVIMAAAVADYTPEHGSAGGKIEKRDAPLDVRLVRTPDILAELGRARRPGAPPVLVGFAAESGDPVPRGREKRRTKNVDLIVANDISRPGEGFDSDTNAVTIISAEEETSVPFALKTEIASAILDEAQKSLTKGLVPGA